MQQGERVEKLIEWFARSTLRHAEALEAMQEDLAAAAVQDLARYYHAVLREGGLERFLTLLDNEDPRVAGMAAVYAMREAPRRCRATLAGLAKLPGLMGFRAQAALERWDKGEWQD